MRWDRGLRSDLGVNASKTPVVVIVGGGFAGLSAAKALKHAPVRVLLIDRTNHHLFQPLLYQVAICVLSPAQIAAPIREILASQRNTKIGRASCRERVWTAEDGEGGKENE